MLERAGERLQSRLPRRDNMAENKQSYDGKERRRAERYGASHPAILKIEGLAAFDCDIQDYCEAGFHLSAAKNSALQNILSAVQVGTKLVVEYSIAANTYTVSYTHLTLPTICSV